jgi:hypothetical protein
VSALCCFFVAVEEQRDASIGFWSLLLLRLLLLLLRCVQ